MGGCVCSLTLGAVARGAVFFVGVFFGVLCGVRETDALVVEERVEFDFSTVERVGFEDILAVDLCCFFWMFFDAPDFLAFCL